jgi:hypothetical protein
MHPAMPPVLDRLTTGVVPCQLQRRGQWLLSTQITMLASIPPATRTGIQRPSASPLPHAWSWCHATAYPGPALRTILPKGCCQPSCNGCLRHDQ